MAGRCRCQTESAHILTRQHRGGQQAVELTRFIAASKRTMILTKRDPFPDPGTEHWGVRLYFSSCRCLNLGPLFNVGGDMLLVLVLRCSPFITLSPHIHLTLSHPFSPSHQQVLVRIRISPTSTPGHVALESFCGGLSSRSEFETLDKI
jgi:hypothetical protein